MTGWNIDFDGYDSTRDSTSSASRFSPRSVHRDSSGAREFALDVAEGDQVTVEKALALYTGVRVVRLAAGDSVELSADPA